MISKIHGSLVDRQEHSLVIKTGGLSYEILVPYSVLQRIGEHLDGEGNISLITYHYLQVGPSSAIPVLVGFFNEIERDFFLKFIKVSGIGPRAAVRALNKPISEISQAIDKGDAGYLRGLPGIGAQKAKEIIAKLQGKVGKYGLIRDQQGESAAAPPAGNEDWQDEAMAVLQQLQYSKQEAKDMIRRALVRSPHLSCAEELINEIYKQRIHAP